MNYFVTQLCNSFSTDSNFWSGIIGALVGSATGGAIAYIMQALSLKEARKTRKDELLLAQQTLATSMLLKVVRIHGNCSAISGHMKTCWARLSDEKIEPWQVVTPFSNFPAPVFFTTEEQTMLFGLKDNKTFEITIDLDVAHNSLIDGTKAMSAERRLLSSNFENETFEGSVGSSTIDKKTYLRLKPKMMEVNDLAQYTMSESQKIEQEALAAMSSLAVLFKKSLGLTLKTELKHKLN